MEVARDTAGAKAAAKGKEKEEEKVRTEVAAATKSDADVDGVVAEVEARAVVEEAAETDLVQKTNEGRGT